MFGLPVATAVIMIGGLGFWVVYTAIFYLITSNWHVEDVDSDKNREAS